MMLLRRLCLINFQSIITQLFHHNKYNEQPSNTLWFVLFMFTGILLDQSGTSKHHYHKLSLLQFSFRCQIHLTCMCNRIYRRHLAFVTCDILMNSIFSNPFCDSAWSFNRNSGDPTHTLPIFQKHMYRAAVASVFAIFIRKNVATKMLRLA